MITYLDTSTLIKLLVEEDGSDSAEAIWDASPRRVSVSLIEVEARAALSAAQRSHRLTPMGHRRSKDALDGLLSQIELIEVRAELVARAAELADVERLRGYDAVHLAAALMVNADLLTTADGALERAAASRGMQVANPLEQGP